MRYKFSIYNSIIDSVGGLYVHSGLSGALAKITSEKLIKAIKGCEEIDSEAFDAQMLESLRKGMFVVGNDLDELEFIKARNNIARFNDSFHLTILPTLHCNMECIYCYENQYSENEYPVSMNTDVRENLKKFVSEYLRLYNGKNMYVDWYGGEPLLEIDTILDLSEWMLVETKKRGINYGAKIISNGTLLTRDVARKLKGVNVTKCQVTIDCTKESHEKRRVLKSGGENYERIVENVKQASQYFTINVRMNVDKSNECYVESAIDEFDKRGMFSGNKNINVYIAPALPATSACAHIVEEFFSPEEFLNISKRFLKKISDITEVKGNTLYLYPSNRTYSCGAVGMNSFLINPKGNIYKCALDINNDSEAVGSVFNSMFMLDVLTPKMNSWLNYTPFELSECRECKYLPLCHGGCPHSRIHGNKPIVDYNCKIFKENFNYSVKLNIESGNGCL